MSVTHKLHHDYVSRTLSKMGAIPKEPMLQRAYLLYCIANSAEHLVMVQKIANIFLKYESYIKASPVDAAARNMTVALMKFLFHGLDDMVLVVYQEKIQNVRNGNDLYDLVDAMYREMMALDRDRGYVTPTVSFSDTQNYKVADFIGAKFVEGGAVDALARKDTIVASLQNGEKIDPLLLTPYSGQFSNFDPRNAIFKVNGDSVNHYNANFKKVGRSSAFLQPKGRMWERYVKFGARDNEQDAIDVIMRVIEGNATASDYRTFLGIVDVTDADRFISEMLDEPNKIAMSTHLHKQHTVHAGESHSNEYIALHPPRPMSGLLDLADPRNLYRTIKTGTPEGDGGGFNPAAPLDPRRIHRVLQKKDHKFKKDRDRELREKEEAATQYNVDRIMEDARRREEANRVQFPSTPGHMPSARPAPPSIEGLYHDELSSSSGSVYSSPASNDFGTTSIESLPLGASMSGLLMDALKAHRKHDIHAISSFHRFHKAHFGVDKIMWSNAELQSLLAAMKVLAVMNVSDRNTIMSEIIDAIREARAEVETLLKSNALATIQPHRESVFERIDETSIQTQLEFIASDLNPLNYLQYLIEKQPIAPVKPAHENLFLKIVSRISSLFTSSKSMKLHQYTSLLKKIHNPGGKLRDLDSVSIAPALIRIEDVPADRAVKFLYECLVLFCSWSPYAYKKYCKSVQGSVLALPELVKNL